jgi:hypothetical protein
MLQRISFFAAIVALLCLIPPYWNAAGSAQIGFIHDDGIYVTTGLSLAKGDGFAIEGYPGLLRQTKYPYVLPALLSVAWHLNPHFPQNIRLLKAVPILGLLAWLLVSYLFLEQYCKIPRTATLWILVAIAANPWTFFLATAIMSETVFSALAMAALLFLLRSERTHWIVLAGIAAGLAYLTRTAGITVIGAGVLAQLLQKRFRGAVLFAGVALCFVLPWILWQHAANTPSATSIERYYTADNYRDYNVLQGGFSRSEILSVMGSNAVMLWTAPGRLLKLQGPSNWLLVIVGSLFWWALYRGVRAASNPGLRLGCYYLAGSLAVLLGYAWYPDRMLVPALAVFCALLYLGTPQRVRPLLLLAPLWSVYLAYNAAAVMQEYGVSTFAETAWIRSIPGYQKPKQWPRIEKLYTWIRQNTPPDALILANHDPAVYLYTGRPSARAFTVDNLALFYGIKHPLDEKVADLRRIIDQYHAAYLLQTGHDEAEEPEYQEMLNQLTQTGQIEQVYQTGDRYAVYRIIQPTGLSARR